jgi:hypothetical protein
VRGSMWRKSRASATRDISAGVLAISTQTVPAPTSTKVSNCWMVSGAALEGSEFLRALKGQQDLAADEVSLRVTLRI